MADALIYRVTQRLEQLRADIVAKIEAEGITASGRTQRSLQVVQDETGARLIAAAGDRAPIQTLEIGREAGKVPRRFYLILAEWSREKGMSFATERERHTFAYFLGKRIAREGTRRHTSPVDVYSAEVQRATEDIRNMILTSVTETIKNNFE